MSSHTLAGELLVACKVCKYLAKSLVFQGLTICLHLVPPTSKSHVYAILSLSIDGAIHAPLWA